MQEEKPNQSALEQLFTKSLPAKVAQLKNSLKALEAGNNRQALEGILAQTKKLAILAEAVQLNQVNSHCKNIISFISNQIDHDKDLNAENITILHAQFELLSHSLELSKAPAFLGKEILTQLHYHTKILLAVDEPGLEKELIEQFAFFGYETVHANNLNEIDKAIQAQEHPLVFAAIIVDMVFCQKLDLSSFDSVPSQIPLIFLGMDDTIEVRLYCVRAGGHAFLKKPIEFSQLLEKIDDLVIPVGESTPYRVMMVEDSKTQASIMQNQLEEAGMTVELVTDPMNISDKLNQFRPELILMDLYMPKCTGVELATVIRQQDSFVGVPIVFLSSESDIAKQMDALRLGGDDFLTKPIEKDHLVSSVSSRIERSRSLRAEMIQDSLTGLLNHTRVLEQLELEINRAERENTALCFVMLDIDHFKKINDKYGHPTGDRVIKSVARLFKQRFRKSDSVGRYGGEEFAVILPHSDAHNILPLIDSIRESFQQITFTSDDGEDFNVTFSAGLANLSPIESTVDKLVQAADKALYTAKHQGRNQIVIFSQEPN